MDLAARLRERRPEIEEAMLARVHGVADPAEVEDPEYAIGLREAVAAALEYAIVGIEGQECATVPKQLLAQARSAARNGVSLDTVLRRYSAGYSLLLDDHLIRVTESPIPGEALKAVLQSFSTAFDRLVAAVCREYGCEEERSPHNAERRRAERVLKLLAGEPVELAELRYEVGAWHLALVISGPGGAAAIRDLAGALDRSLLLVDPTAEEAWVWLGGRSRLAARELLGLAEQSLPAEASIAVGEPGKGIAGWRLSHRQAKAAMAVLRRGGERCVRYADVALLASALRDDVLASSLREIFLAPLEGERDGGATLRRTLGAYFEAGQNASSAAAMLGVSRSTISVRLRSVEEKIGRPVDSLAGELGTALRLRDLTSA